MQLTIQCNRMSRLLEAAAARVRPDLAAKGPGVVQFTYMCDAPLTLTLQPNDQLLRLMSPKFYNAFADKGRLPLILDQLGLIGDVAPPTCFSVAEALAQKDVRIWFSKNRHGTSGKSMEVIAADDLNGYTLPNGHVLQAGVEHLRLVEGRKAITRIYFLLWNRKAFLFGDGFHVVHGVPYEEGSTSYDVQINHEGYLDPAKAVELRPLRRDPDFAAVIAAARRMAQKLVPALQLLLKGTSATEFVMLGLDTAMQQTGEMKLIEINAVPNFVHTKEVNETVNIPFLEFAMRTMMDLPSSTRGG